MYDAPVLSLSKSNIVTKVRESQLVTAFTKFLDPGVTLVRHHFTQLHDLKP